MIAFVILVILGFAWAIAGVLVYIDFCADHGWDVAPFKKKVIFSILAGPFVWLMLCVRGSMFILKQILEVKDK